MITCAVVHGPATIVSELQAFFDDDHVHCALIVDQGSLIAVVDRRDVVDRNDLASAGGSRVVRLGRLDGRVVRPDADLADTRRQMVAAQRRRLAVVDTDGTLSGLLCLKGAGTGFCSDSDVQARRSALN